jgi:glycosyltransferase involved in cell wall biosynthesis
MNSVLPRISVITPSYNQAAFLERTILSILNQGYPNLEYIIIDGGSTDGSVDIIKRYSNQLAYWESVPDRGQSHAINKGLQHATGDWVCWQNSDDIFYPKAFEILAKTIKKNPDLDLIIGNVKLINEVDELIRPMCYVRPTYKSLLAEGMVLTNQAAFWRHSMHKKIGWLDESLHYGFDYEWFLRILKFTNASFHVPVFIGALRFHSETKTSLNQDEFKLEYSKILQGRALNCFEKYFYTVRRLILTIADGEISYVFNGLKRRVKFTDFVKSVGLK